jgi:hypothetical protein
LTENKVSFGHSAFGPAVLNINVAYLPGGQHISFFDSPPSFEYIILVELPLQLELELELSSSQ